MLLCACTPTNEPLVVDMSVEPNDVHQNEDLTVDVGPDAPPDLNEKETIDPCEGGIRWELHEDTPFAGRDHHATFITTRGTPTLHVVGGTDYGQIFSDHWQAPISEDGSLETWESGVPLPFRRAGQSVVSTGEDVWLITGRDQGGFVSNTLRATFDAAGEIDGWVEEAAVPEARFHSAGVHDGDTVWVTGGLIMSGEAQSTIYRAVMTDGEITGWEIFELPEPRSHHAAFVHEGAVHLALGFSGNSFQNATTPHHDMIRFPANASPGLLETESVATLAEDISTMSMTVTEQCARTFGGLTYLEDSGVYQYQPLSWKIMLNAAPMQFVQQGPLNVGRSHMHQVPYHNGVFYVVGGSMSYQDVTNSVEIGRLTP